MRLLYLVATERFLATMTPAHKVEYQSTNLTGLEKTTGSNLVPIGKPRPGIEQSISKRSSVHCVVMHQSDA